MVHDGVILQSKDEKVESIIHDPLNYKSLICYDEDVTTQNDQWIFRLMYLNDISINNLLCLSLSMNKQVELIGFSCIHLMVVMHI